MKTVGKIMKTVGIIAAGLPLKSNPGSWILI